VFWKTATREFLWFLTGDTNIRALCAQGVEIWTDWPLDRYRRETGDPISRADFSARIVADKPSPRGGAISARSMASNGSTGRYEPDGQGAFRRRDQGVNQVADVVRSLRANPGSRRHIRRLERGRA
jgi:thymidylate synthase